MKSFAARTPIIPIPLLVVLSVMFILIMVALILGLVAANKDRVEITRLHQVDIVAAKALAHTTKQAERSRLTECILKGLVEALSKSEQQATGLHDLAKRRKSIYRGVDSELKYSICKAR